MLSVLHPILYCEEELNDIIRVQGERPVSCCTVQSYIGEPGSGNGWVKKQFNQVKRADQLQRRISCLDLTSSAARFASASLQLSVSAGPLFFFRRDLSPDLGPGRSSLYSEQVLKCGDRKLLKIDSLVRWECKFEHGGDAAGRGGGRRWHNAGRFCHCSCGL